MLAWSPEGDYPGAALCIYCSFGVLVKKGSVEEAVSETGVEGFAGVMRTHYVNQRLGTASYKKPS